MKRKLLTITLTSAICLSIILCSCNKIDSDLSKTMPDKTSENTTVSSQIQTSTTKPTENTTTSTATSEVKVTSTSNTTTSKTTVTTLPPKTETTTKATTVVTTAPKPVTTTTKATTTTTSKTTTKPPETTTQTTTQPVPQRPVHPNNYCSLNFNEPNGVWITFFEMDRLIFDKNGYMNSEYDFTQGVKEIVKNSKDLGINTLYVHVRAFSDAYYESDYYPPAKKYGDASSPMSYDYDPVKIFIDIAHENGLSFHAWINPLRGSTKSAMSYTPKSYLTRKWADDPNTYSEYSTYISNYYFLNPAKEDVRNLVCNGVKEIVSKYDVDGIHIDDYFYPPATFTGKDSYGFDNKSFLASGRSNLINWRIDNVNTLVKQIYNSIKDINSTVEFGISPSGNVGNNIGKWGYLCADVYKWTSEKGYLDYIVPQVYFDTKTLKNSMDVWNDMIEIDSIKLVYGLAPYKIGTGTGEWASDSDIIAGQIDILRDLSNCKGISLYRYDSLFNPASSVKSKVNNELISIKEKLKQ